MLYEMLQDKFKAFDERHNDDNNPPITDFSMGGYDQVTVFPSGVHRDRHGNFYQDVEGEECLRRRIWYWEKRQQQAKKEFKDLKRDLEARLAATLRPDQEGLERLKELQKLIAVDCQREIENARWELSLHPLRTRKRMLSMLHDQDEIRRLRDMSYADFLAERRAEDEERKVIADREERRRDAITNSKEYTDYQQELEMLQLDA